MYRKAEGSGSGSGPRGPEAATIAAPHKPCRCLNVCKYPVNGGKLYQTAKADGGLCQAMIVPLKG